MPKPFARRRKPEGEGRQAAASVCIGPRPPGWPRLAAACGRAAAGRSAGRIGRALSSLKPRCSTLGVSHANPATRRTNPRRPLARGARSPGRGAFEGPIRRISTEIGFGTLISWRKSRDRIVSARRVRRRGAAAGTASSPLPPPAGRGGSARTGRGAGRSMIFHGTAVAAPARAPAAASSPPSKEGGKPVGRLALSSFGRAGSAAGRRRRGRAFSRPSRRKGGSAGGAGCGSPLPRKRGGGEGQGDPQRELGRGVSARL